ncbi:MAG: orotidine-5'-phosphate decarboxylase [Flavobacteriaceae bacterium]|jgi:orotidine-5'-phosphate decarboxylase|nr:orotidine-5'-phosphate decarboxylase [Flavobacteriaceae bacterium]MBT4246108.1 orotidine-5'-phosphate decarboxylase [Flavobacteriaceae bacterium]MBT4415893.1 orotidine-5'-phosphate decarboxylase [Flavobacteriaceae bacterium]MBT5012780.1 orotidine-5'-phosphate decarboxylase [Flavobacteriaceae bacterium]MBT5395500.1 orotidine-5'-phosphate decarboxylase [Flavobacteriaceae bacterium]
MDITHLEKQIQHKQSFLCLGLDSDLSKIPNHLLNKVDPIFSFNKSLLDSLNELIVAVKINTAFYEANGSSGWLTLEKTIRYINNNYPDLFTIADAKRGDIGNTSDKYAQAFFNTLEFDSITVSPYMGSDSIAPFLKYKDKQTILLGLTSNKGAEDFQLFPDLNNSLFKRVLTQSKQWNHSNNLMYVVGATKAAYLKDIRSIVPDNFLLIPGVGTQGGSLKEIFDNGANNKIGLLVNSSRSIIYASKKEDYLIEAFKVAQKLQFEMKQLILRCL